MQLSGKILAGTTTTLTTKKGTQLDKTRLKVLDTGEETAGDVVVYWVDFMGDAALSDAELAQVNHQEAVIEIRKVTASVYNGKSYLNLSGGLIITNGKPIQPKLSHGALGQVGK